MTTLEGQFLVAMPAMADERFTETVIYLFGHTSDGAMGIVVNQPLADVDFGTILEQIEIGDPDMVARLPETIRSMPVLQGGPVERGRGFVLHTDDYESANSYSTHNGIRVTATLDVLQAMAFGPRPDAALLALGCCGWSPGQLDQEILDNSWLTLPFSREIMFELPLEDRYDAALATLHITRASLSQEAGHA